MRSPVAYLWQKKENIMCVFTYISRQKSVDLNKRNHVCYRATLAFIYLWCDEGGILWSLSLCIPSMFPGSFSLHLRRQGISAASIGRIWESVSRGLTLHEFNAPIHTDNLPWVHDLYLGLLRL